MLRDMILPASLHGDAVPRHMILHASLNGPVEVFPCNQIHQNALFSIGDRQEALVHASKTLL